MSNLYTVWYMTPEHFPAGIAGRSPAADLSTHKKVKSFQLDSLFTMTKESNDKQTKKLLEHIFEMQQGENWSPNGEATPLLESLGLSHATMSVGDVVECDDGRYWMVDNIGFKELNHIKL